MGVVQRMLICDCIQVRIPNHNKKVRLHTRHNSANMAPFRENIRTLRKNAMSFVYAGVSKSIVPRHDAQLDAHVIVCQCRTLAYAVRVFAGHTQKPVCQPQREYRWTMTCCIPSLTVNDRRTRLRESHVPFQTYTEVIHYRTSTYVR